MRTKTLILVSLLIKFATGLALLAVPNVVAKLLLGIGLAPPGEAVARVGGYGLISLEFGVPLEFRIACACLGL